MTSTEALPNDLEDAAKALEANRIFKKTVVRVAKEFMILRKTLLDNLPDISLDREQTNKTTERFQHVREELVKDHEVSKQLALTVFGPNSSGKSAFLQHFLRIGDILPSDVGPVTARIVKLTYSPADRAYTHIFASLDDRLAKKPPLAAIKLESFFLQKQAPQWEKVAESLQEHLKRAENYSIDTEGFAKWAKHFVEIGLPSPILQLGIDMYDTPGFLSNNRDEVLNNNLHELIKYVHPTLLFLYENSAISETDKSCFLALKGALGSLENVSIFFLNTKADVVSIFKNERVNQKRDVPPEKFQQVLRRTRVKRYALLLEHEIIANEVIGGLPVSIDDCECFDICTIPKDLTPWRQYADMMNAASFRRIVQFAVRTNVNPSQSLADGILSSIDEFFDLALSTTYRTTEEWIQLRDDALQWGEKFFYEFKRTLPIMSDKIHENILLLFDEHKLSIAERAGNLIRTEDPLMPKMPASSKRVADFIHLAVSEEVMKVAANKTMNAIRDKVDWMFTNDAMMNKRNNELLNMARRHITFFEISANDLNREKLFASILTHLLKVPRTVERFIQNIRTLAYREWHNEHTNAYELLDALDAYANLFNESKRKELALKDLTKMRTTIVNQKILFRTNLDEWMERKRTQFMTRIHNGYQYAIKHTEQWKQAKELTTTCINQFATFECQLLAAKDLIKFNGVRPTIIVEQTLGAGGFFNVHPAQWADKQDMAVKIQLSSTKVDHPHMAYVEAHYHRAITRSNQRYIAPLLYLYENSANELCIFMPKYKQSLQSYLRAKIKTIQIDQVLSFALIIAMTLVEIHRNGLVHRDIKSSNILLNDDNQCYLSDFGTVKAGNWASTIVGTMPLPPEMIVGALSQLFGMSSLYEGTAVDIYAYGLVLYEMLPKEIYHRPDIHCVGDVQTMLSDPNVHALLDNDRMSDYKELIIACLQSDPADRPGATVIVQRLESVIRDREDKQCIVCLSRRRAVRTLPCRHKVVCQQCRQTFLDRNDNRCILCKQHIERDTKDDINSTFFVPSQ